MQTNNKTSNKIKCAWCEQEFTNKISLANHFDNIHNDLYDCRIDQLHPFNNSFISDYQTQTGKIYSI